MPTHRLVSSIVQFKGNYYRFQEVKCDVIGVLDGRRVYGGVREGHLAWIFMFCLEFCENAP